MKNIFVFGIITLSLIAITSTAFTSTIQLPKTGQTKCYDTAGNQISCAGTDQDGAIQAGVIWPNPRFTVNSDSTITDNLTGLIWAPDGNVMQSRDPGFDNDTTGDKVGDGAVTWYHALDYVAKLNNENYLGHSDWRLPNINELESLINTDVPTPATWLNSQGFTNVQLGNWSSTNYPVAANGYGVSVMNITGDGYIGMFQKSYEDLFVFPVRDGQGGAIDLPKTGQNVSSYNGDDGALQKGISWPNPRFYDNLDGTVTDNLTGLMWSKNANLPNSPVVWQDAINYCKNLTLGGHSDWRLPNKEELRSLIDYSQFNPALPQGHPFINTQYGGYWSSTTFVYETDYAWFVDLYYGYVSGSNKSQSYGRAHYSSPFFYNYYLLPVRGGVGITTTTTTIHQGINAGLVAYYPFNGNANDESGNGNNGTIYGNPQFVNGVIGNALQFDGIDDYMHSASLNINTGDSFTVSYWINFKWQQSRFWILYFGYDANAFPCSVPEGFHALITGLNWSPAAMSGFGFMCGGGVGGNGIYMANFEGQWIHVVTIFDSLNETLSTFINAISQEGGSATITQVIPMQNIGLYIGQCPLGYPDNNNFKGTLDDIRIYNRALSEAEILQLYNLQNTSTTTTSISTTTTTIDASVKADFYGSPTAGEAPLTVNFTNLSTGNIDAYEWDFGDGSAKSSEQSPTHIYQKAGTYSVRLTVTGNNGNKDTKVKESCITVTNSQECPFKTTLNNTEFIYTLHMLRDKQFNNFYGKLLTSFFYRNAVEVNSILSAHPELQERLRGLVAENIFIAEELVNKGTAHLPQRNAEEITAFLSEIAKDGSLWLKFYTALVINGIEYRFLMNGIGLNIN